MDDIQKYTRLIKDKAIETGFADCGIAAVEKLVEEELILNQWLLKGMHAGMEWMERNKDKRVDPSLLVPGARSIISVLLNYYTEEMQSDPEAPVISKYAYGRDYHKVMKKKLKNLLSYIQEIIPGAYGRAFVDSAPVLEHAWASRSGLGWIGKNSLLLSKDYGSYVFIGELIIDKELQYDQPMNDHCGTCTLCINECPTHAINNDRTVDSGKCISYLTIENRNEIPEKFRNSFFNRVFGCDICQEVCPWNKKLKAHNIPDLQPSGELMNLNKQDWEEMTEEDFNRIFVGSTVKRTKFSGLKRNIEFLGLGD